LPDPHRPELTGLQQVRNLLHASGQRIAVPYHITGMTADETTGYRKRQSRARWSVRRRRADRQTNRG
jgi:hypothetical protein